MQQILKYFIKNRYNLIVRNWIVSYTLSHDEISKKLLILSRILVRNLIAKALNKYEGTEFRIYVFDVTSRNK
jgi:hypothetical protein